MVIENKMCAGNLVYYAVMAVRVVVSWAWMAGVREMIGWEVWVYVYIHWI